MRRAKHTGGLGSIQSAAGEVKPYEGAAFQPSQLLPRCDVGASVGQPYNLYFRPDGRRFYTVSRSGDNIHEFRLAKRWRVDSAVYVGATALPGIGTAEGLAFKPDGTTLYVSDTTSVAAIRQYALSTPWDLSTLTNPGIAGTTNAQDTAPCALVFKPDGTKFFMTGRTNQRAYEYTLSTPWLISSRVYVGLASLLSPEYGLAVSPDGTKLFHDRGANSELAEYTLGTAWSLGGTNTAVTPRRMHNQLRHLFYRDDGKALYIMDVNNILQQYGGH